MTVLGVLGSKGGTGASLVATNLAVALTFEGKVLLVDLHSHLAYDDLLLDLKPGKSWADLLPVADELTERHLELSLTKHASGLNLLAAPETRPAMDADFMSGEVFQDLLRGLKDRFDWTVVDLPIGVDPPVDQVLEMIDALLLIITGDLPALRNARRTLKSLPPNLRMNTVLVVNQLGRGHPVDPEKVANALELDLIAALPPDPRAVGYQVSFGTPTALDSRSPFGRKVMEMTEELLKRLAGVAGEIEPEGE